MNNWELTNEEKNQLSEHDRKLYDKAVSYKNHDWAEGPYGGWVRGNKILLDLGWKEVLVTKGHRGFVSLIKPKKINYHPITQ